tara:strand:- start:121 stop:408 length:288 start_codon:yes stop_codon:yes gene_type:complete
MKNNKIVNIDHIFEITNGTLEDLQMVNPNQVGQVKNENGKVISSITPIIMVFNQNRGDKNERIEILRNNGGDFDKIINYYGKDRTIKEIINYENI